MTTVHVVSHTHWDREWYLPAVRFRQRLVALVDELIDDPPAERGASFLLDGQTVVLDDYLDVRPERREALFARLRSGALEAGPWFAQADELIPGGESLVRNLLAGRRALDSIGVHAPPVMYCPDTFGHPAALPMLARGFGCTSVILSRGYGGARWPDGDTAWWIGPDGERVLLYHLSKSGYETGAHLPPGDAEAASRWREIRADLVPRSRLGVVLLMNGADHHARQAGLDDAVAALARVAAPDDVRPSSLTAFAAALAERAATATLPEVRGELRDSYGWMWTLQGTFATRSHQKRRNARAERLLVRDVEPWVALAGRVAPSPATRARRRLLHTAWRSLVLCHPHDTICGCSTDEVARAMDARLDEAESQALGLRGDAILDAIGHSQESARVRREDWKPMVVVRNAAPRPRAGLAALRLTSFLADVKVGIHPDATPAAESAPTTPAIRGAAAVQLLARRTEDELTESPRHYPDDDRVAVSDVLAWIPEVPACGIRCFPHTTRAKRGSVPNPARADGPTITNGRVALRIGEDGRVSFSDLALGRSLEDLVQWESRVDLGDEYTPSPRGAKFTPRFRGARVVHRGPLRATLVARWELRTGRERADLAAEFSVDADARFVRVRVTGENAAKDHRLRMSVATGVTGGRVVADAMFGPVERPPLNVNDADARMEYPLPTAPLHRYVSLFGPVHGATVYSDGLAEYEAEATGRVAIALLRAVGELSRADLPERPGNAGWPTPTPGAQCIGPFAGEFAVLLHGAQSPSVVDDIERTADDVLLPLTGATLRSALALPSPVHGVELTGEGLAVSTIKESDAEDGQWLVLRCVNLVDRDCEGTWTLGADVADARLARLDETPQGPVHFSGRSVSFTARPRAVVTVLVRQASFPPQAADR